MERIALPLRCFVLAPPSLGAQELEFIMFKIMLTGSLLIGAAILAPTLALAQVRLDPALLNGVGVGAQEAQYRRGYGGRRYYGNRRGYNGGAAAAGIIGGLAAGAIIGGALSNQYGQPQTIYGAPDQGAVDYCIQRFRSYDVRSGTYVGYDGMRHSCP